MIEYNKDEKHRAGGRIDEIKIIQMIKVQILRGNGTEWWPYHHETLFYDMNGNLKYVERFYEPDNKPSTQ